MLGLVPCLEIWGRTDTPVPLYKAQNTWRVEVLSKGLSLWESRPV